MPSKALSLFHRVENALETIALASTPLETIHATAEFLAANFADDLGIKGGRIYRHTDGSYELVKGFGEATEAPIGLRVWKTYPPFEEMLDTGMVVMNRDDARLDQHLEKELGTRELFAAIAVSDGQYVLSFDVDTPNGDHEDLHRTLNIIRLAVNQKLREERMVAIMEDARQIQNSILPRHLPKPGDYEIAARSVAAEIVGGDFYDVIVLDDEIFDVVIADAAGHGLPAALQVRDVFTGLRMALTRDYKISRTVKKLNEIINRSRLATKFVSLVLLELDLEGTVIYCNAGHPRPILMRVDGSVERLDQGGPILGPVPNASYSIGIQCMGPGDLLVLFTDGVSEARADDDEEYGFERLIHAVRTVRHHDPAAIVDRIFNDVAEFAPSSPPEDDQTVVVIKRRPPVLEEAPA
ncbi:MAG: PP2C family protein-serine/threonine phosphatase [Thermoanaerobaculales bacterium]|jgi:sigma-B regulation protein RsbU (phosphoserine phosphatase)|nr:PP2C family protein-serine/threonine phosphatase [Thermoanaerobaculales bacterium]